MFQLTGAKYSSQIIHSFVHLFFFFFTPYKKYSSPLASLLIKENIFKGEGHFEKQVLSDSDVCVHEPASVYSVLLEVQ